MTTLREALAAGGKFLEFKCDGSCGNRWMKEIQPTYPGVKSALDLWGLDSVIRDIEDPCGWCHGVGRVFRVTR